MTPFGLYLEKLRRGHCLQQQQLADQIGVSSCYISALENGHKGPPSEEVVTRLAKALALNHREHKQLQLTAAVSLQQRRLPKQTSLHEYTLIHQLWQRLGTLSEAETIALRSILNINAQINEESPTTEASI